MVLLLVACYPMQPRIANMPKLDITVNEVGFFELQSQCYKYIPLWFKLLGAVSFGCAIYNFNQNTCTIYVLPNHTSALEHELEHCAGGDHYGQMQRDYNNYLKSKE
jgi:hypothetical protein